MDKPTKAKPSAKADDAPEPRHVEAAPTVAIAGVYIRRPVYKETTDSVVWQKLRGHSSLGAELISLTRSAIASCDGDPTEVVRKVIGDLPEAVRAKCEKADADPVAISRKVERHLPRPPGSAKPDDRKCLRSQMIARRMVCFEAHPDVEHVRGNTWRGTDPDRHRFALDMEAVDRANGDLLYQREWREIPEKVMLAILTGLGYPRPDNLTRPRTPWEIPEARPK